MNAMLRRLTRLVGGSVKAASLRHRADDPPDCVADCARTLSPKYIRTLRPGNGTAGGSFSDPAWPALDPVHRLGAGAGLALAHGARPASQHCPARPELPRPSGATAELNGPIGKGPDPRGLRPPLCTKDFTTWEGIPT